jgi:hypothetical protein
MDIRSSDGQAGQAVKENGQHGYSGSPLPVRRPRKEQRCYEGRQLQEEMENLDQDSPRIGKYRKTTRKTAAK